MPTLPLITAQWSLPGRKYGFFNQLRLLHIRFSPRDPRDHPTTSCERAPETRERHEHTEGLKGSEEQGLPIRFVLFPRCDATNPPWRFSDDAPSPKWREELKQDRHATTSESKEETKVKPDFVRYVFDEDHIDGARLMSRVRIEEKAIPWRGIQHRHIDSHNNENNHYAADSEDFRINESSSEQGQPHEVGSEAASSNRDTLGVQDERSVSNSGLPSPWTRPKRALSLLDSVAKGQARKMGRRSQEEELTESGTSKTSVRITDDLPRGSKWLQVASRQSSPPAHTLSLFEELFPEEAKGKRSRTEAGDISQQNDIPRLPPPELDALDRSHVSFPTPAPKLIAREASVNAFRLDNPTVLVLSGASRSLVESDFRRIAPKGMHIEEWRGLGNILKILPARNPNTLESEPHYFLIFDNPSHARMYQSYVIHLDQLAKKYTPTSYASPIMPPPGMLINGENVYTLLQDYTLCASSQRLSIRLLQPPYATSITSMLQNNGYPKIVSPIDKSGRSVLFWVNGRRPSTLLIEEMLDKDGMNRGSKWGPRNGKGSIELIKSSYELNEAENSHSTNDIELKDSNFSRWIVAFEDENEARRFVRTWHRLPFPFPVIRRNPGYEEPLNLIHAEFLW